MLVDKSHYDQLVDIPWTLLENKYCLKYLFNVNHYLILVTDLRLVWFEYGNIEKIKAGAKKNSNIEIEDEKEATGLLSRLKRIFIERSSKCLVVDDNQKLEIHCKEEKEEKKLIAFSWTFECELIDQLSVTEGYTGPDILYREFMLPALSLANHCKHQDIDTHSKRELLPDTLALFSRFAQEISPGAQVDAPKDNLAENVKEQSPKIEEDMQEKRRQELKEYLKEKKTFKKRKRLL